MHAGVGCTLLGSALTVDGLQYPYRLSRPLFCAMVSSWFHPIQDFNSHPVTARTGPIQWLAMRCAALRCGQPGAGRGKPLRGRQPQAALHSRVVRAVYLQGALCPVDRSAHVGSARGSPSHRCCTVLTVAWRCWWSCVVRRASCTAGRGSLHLGDSSSIQAEEVYGKRREVLKNNLMPRTFATKNSTLRRLSLTPRQ